MAAQPVELLLTPGSTGWETVQSLWAGRVPYATLLTQRAVGGAWGAHRNRTNNQISSLMVERLLEALDAAEVPYWSTEGQRAVGAKFLAGKATDVQANFAATGQWFVTPPAPEALIG